MLDIYILCEYNIHMMNMKRRLFLVIASLICLISGLIIYIFLREGTFIHLFFEKNFFVREISAFSADNFFVSFLKYYFVDYLWCVSLSFLLTAISYEISFRKIVFISVSSSLFGILLEAAQFFSVINGTADFIDVSMYVAAGVFSAAFNIVIFNKALSRRE